MSDLFVLPPAPAIWTPEPAPVPQGWLDGYITHFSSSGIRLLKICPEAWRQRYILGRKERPGEALVLGNAVHDSLKFTHTQKIETHEDLPVPVVTEYYNDVSWPQQVERDGGVDEIRWDGKPDKARNDGVRVLQAYHHVVSPRVQPLAVEERFDIVVPGVPVPFIGYIDVEEEANSVDVKTGKQVSRKPDGNWRFQGQLYSLAKGKPTHFHSVSRAQTPSIATPLESEEMVVDVHDLERQSIEKMLRAFAADVEMYFERYGPDEDWPTTGKVMDYRGGPACNFCGFRKWCPAWAHERVVELDMVDIHGETITGTV